MSESIDKQLDSVSYYAVYEMLMSRNLPDGLTRDAVMDILNRKYFLTNMKLSVALAHLSACVAYIKDKNYAGLDKMLPDLIEVSEYDKPDPSSTPLAVSAKQDVQP